MNKPNDWRAIVQGPLQQSVLQVVSEVAQRLRNPERSIELARLASSQSDSPYIREWTASSVTYGHASLAMLFGQMDRCFPDEGWDRTAHIYLAFGARAIENTPQLHLFPGLFGGLSGLCFTTYCLSHNGSRYQHLLASLDEILINNSGTKWRSPAQLTEGVSFLDYDLISGPTGIGAYLLLRQTNPAAASELIAIINRLLYLCEGPDELSRFFIPPEKQVADWQRNQHPHGCIDCGVAHGVPGPLAFLAVSRLQGLTLPGLPQAIQHLANWVIEQRDEDEWGPTWPSAISPKGIRSPEPPRATWCYGNAGVARALWLAGCALNDLQLQASGIEAIQAIARRPSVTHNIPSPILCHGVAGLLQVVLRFAHDTNDPICIKLACELTEQLLGLFQSDSPVGFRDITQDGGYVDDPGLLCGAAGVVLALLASAADAEPIWDRMFLLS